jgi:hypothetical protein
VCFIHALVYLYAFSVLCPSPAPTASLHYHIVSKEQGRQQVEEDACISLYIDNLAVETERYVKVVICTLPWHEKLQFVACLPSMCRNIKSVQRKDIAEQYLKELRVALGENRVLS